MCNAQPTRDGDLRFRCFFVDQDLLHDPLFMSLGVKISCGILFFNFGN